MKFMSMKQCVIKAGQLFGLCWLFTISSAAFANTLSTVSVDIFVSDTDRLTNVIALKRQVKSLTIHNMDNSVRLDAQLSQGLSSDPAVAEQQARARMTGINQQAIREAWTPVVKASFYDIKKIPAIVFNDGEAVVYGITDVMTAAGFYQKHQQQKSN